MSKIAFIGLGNMGGGMAANQAKAGHDVAAFDLSPAALERAAPKEGIVELDGDTVMMPATMEAAMRAVGGATLAVDEVMQRIVANAFVAMRPPGHHAERATPMGFCFFNNAAVAARHAQKVHGAERVAIMDFDVHHGNGTQDILGRQPGMLYLSSHQEALYPGTGYFTFPPQAPVLVPARPILPVISGSIIIARAACSPLALR